MNIYNSILTFSNDFKNCDEVKEFKKLKKNIDENPENKKIIDDFHKKLYDYQIAKQNGEDVAEKEKQLYDESQMLEFEKVVILRVVDSLWTDHIDEMDQLRQSIGLRGYGQLNPLVEYQQDGFRMFEQMVGAIEYDVTRLFLKAEIRQDIKR